MWIFCKTVRHDNTAIYSIGFIQGSAGVWVEAMTTTDFKSAVEAVNFLNGGSARMPYGVIVDTKLR
jgi:hypothetical protein